MNYRDALVRDARRVIGAQTVLMLACTAGFGAAGGLRAGLAALYGGMIAVLVTGWLAWRLGRARDLARSRSAGWATIYTSAFVRYAAVMVLVAAGVGGLKLPPLPLLGAFALSQLGFLAGARRT